MPPREILPYEAGAVLTVDLAALVANWRTLQTVCGEAECGAVVKADAYGLGLEPIVKALAAAGCKTFFVGHVFEGRDVRALAPEATIYVLNGLRPRTGHIFADHVLRPVLCSVPDMEDFGQFCATSGRRWPDGSKLKAGLHLDIGLHRLGLGPYDLERADHLAPLFDVTLLLAELARSDDICRAERQFEVFDAMRARFPGRAASIANSAAIFREEAPLYELVRPGYALYGGNPVPGRPNPMRPVVKLEAQIIELRILEPGARVGDVPGWRAGGPRRIAMIAAGLGDGIPLSLTKGKSGAVALVQGKRCPFVSGIGMDHSVLDVTDATYLERGEWVELIGKTLTIDDFSAQAGRSGYEVLAHLGRRCHRRYQKSSRSGSCGTGSAGSNTPFMLKRADGPRPNLPWETQMQMDLEGPSLAALSCGKAVWLVVILHGVGADGNDVIDLALNWQPIIPKAEFVALHAPFPFDQAPTGKQWFSIADRSPDKVRDGIREAAAILDPCLDELLAKRRLDDSHLALVGFSQGAMMALHVGMRRKKKIAGVVAFSGALVAAETLAAEIASKPPVLLVHGEADDVVPFAAMGEAKEALKSVEVPVRALRRPGLGHAIDDDGVIAAGDFLTAHLVSKKAEADHAH